MSDARMWCETKALVLISDDWGMCAWCPTAQTYEEVHPLPFMRTPWSSGTLEMPSDMEHLFSVLEDYQGGDGLPCLFQPMYVVNSPDFDAIAANGFGEYVDVAIDQGVSPGWERGDLAAKAREGWRRGVWQPGYHGRAHHFSPRRWIERLQKGDEWAHFTFERGVYVCETVPDRLPEYVGLSDAEQVAWVDEGLAVFERAFGYAARTARNADFTPRVVDRLVERGVRAVTDEARLADTESSSVTVLRRLINFEPFLASDHEDLVPATVAAIEAAWAAGRPAVVSTHRRNYKGFDVGDVERNFRALRGLLGALCGKHSDLVFLCGDEVAQLQSSGNSCVRRGDRIICRNYGEAPATMTVDVGEERYTLEAPPGEVIIRLR